MALYLIPSFLSENTSVLAPETIEVAKKLDEFVVESEKSARQFLKLISSAIKQSDFIFHLLNEHSTEPDLKVIEKILLSEKSLGLLSDAGCPGIADPGAEVVRLAHINNVRVIPLIGPSSILMSLMASGLNGQQFTFHGYLPREQVQRKNKIQLLEKEILKKNETQIFIEAPYRNQNILSDILSVCQPDTLLCIATNLTSKDENINTKRVAEWKKNIPDINKQPTIFLLGN